MVSLWEFNSLIRWKVCFYFVHRVSYESLILSWDTEEEHTGYKKNFPPLPIPEMEKEKGVSIKI